MKEYVFANECAAHDERRKFINRNFSVSLIAFDPSRDAYVFDVYGG